MFNVDDEKAKLSVRGTHSNVRQLFEKRAEQIKGSINDRAKYGATKSVLINMKNNIVGDSDKVQED